MAMTGMTDNPRVTESKEQSGRFSVPTAPVFPDDSMLIQLQSELICSIGCLLCRELVSILRLELVR